MTEERAKIAVVVRDDLEVWQKLNVVTFLASGIAAAHPETIGQPYADADGRAYTAIFGLPVLIYGAAGEKLGRALSRANERGLTVGVYDRGMFATGNDTDNRAVVSARPTGDLDLVGIAVHGGAKEVDKALKGLKFHP